MAKTTKAELSLGFGGWTVLRLALPPNNGGIGNGQPFDSASTRPERRDSLGIAQSWAIMRNAKPRLGVSCVDREGIEPPTHGFSVHCSTN